MGANITDPQGNAAESEPANHRQADYFRDELHRQINLLNEHVRKCQAKLATSSQREQADQVRHIQAQLRNCAIERRELLDLLAMLNSRFP